MISSESSSSESEYKSGSVSAGRVGKASSIGGNLEELLRLSRLCGGVTLYIMLDKART